MNTVLQRILYVEDEQDFHEIARLALEDIGGLQLKVCSSGPEALDAASAFYPDMVLLDAMMPGMDGVETFKKLRNLSELDSVPILFMTANALPGEIARFMELGAADVIPKPFDPMTLSQTIQDIWEKISPPFRR